MIFTPLWISPEQASFAWWSILWFLEYEVWNVERQMLATKHFKK